MSSRSDDELFALPQVASEPSGSRRQKATVIELQQRRQEAEQRLQAITAERAGYAFDAVTMRGASPARRSLDRLRQEEAAITDELRDLESAIETAELRLAAARATARESAVVADANRAIELGEKLRGVGVECDDLLAKFAIHYRELQGVIDELHKLGFAPNPRLAHLAAERALSSALLPTRLAPRPGLLPPGQRTSMSTVAEQYAGQAVAQAKRVVNGEAA